MTEHLIDRIQTFNAGRIPEMLSLKYAAMAENPYRFFRGTNHLFCDTLAAKQLFTDSPHAWLCGDLHLENFGTFRSDNRLVYFDLNDFDDAVLGPVAWEVLRFVTSIFVGFSSLKISDKKAVKMSRLFLKTYLATLVKAKSITVETRNASGIVGDFLRKVKRRTQGDLMRKRTRKHKNKIEILLDMQKHQCLPDDFKTKLTEHVQEWLRHDGRSPYNYKVTDAVFRIAGTSSLGLHRYVVLLKSSNSAGEKYLLIDMKEAAPSPLFPHLRMYQPHWSSEAQRITTVQERMQDRCPAMMSTCDFEGRSYLMEEMQPEEDNINFQLLAERYRDMYIVIDTMAMLTASAQLRSSGRQGSATADTLREWACGVTDPEPMIEYCRQYSQIVEADYRYYCAQFASGVIH